MSAPSTDELHDPAEPAPPAGVDRRKFLIGAGAAVVASAVVSQRWPLGRDEDEDLPGLMLDAIGEGHRPLAVGFVEGSDRDGADLVALPYGDGRVVPGRSGRGDPSFVGGDARVSIVGLTAGFDAGRNPRFSAVDVDALLPHPQRSVREPLRHFAWSLRTTPLHRSSPTSYTVAIGRRPRIGFTVGVTDHAGETVTASTVFAAGADGEAISLRRGTYLLGLDPNAWVTARPLPSAGDAAWTDLLSIVVTVDHA